MMKALILFLLLFGSVFLFGQQDVEDRDDSFNTEVNKNILKINIKEPILQIAIKNCNDFRPAAYDGGVSVYKEMLRKYMYNYLNSDFYVLNGDFNFTITISETGKVIDIAGSPKVANSEIFFDDMRYIVRRIKKGWIPAACNNIPVTSQIKIKMNLSSIATDL